MVWRRRRKRYKQREGFLHMALVFTHWLFEHPFRCLASAKTVIGASVMLKEWTSNTEQPISSSK